MTQRQLAFATGIAQPTIARIERRLTVPRVDTMDRLLRATGHCLEVDRSSGQGIDRSLIRELLSRPVEERVGALTAEARFLDELDGAVPCTRR